MAITDADIVRAASALGVMGGGPQSAHRILASLCDGNLGSREIAQLIQREPGLAARVLKIANSAFYGHSRDVSTLDRALMVLGLDAVRGITAAACLDRSVVRRGSKTAIDPDALVNHCVASAFVAEAMAKRSGRASPAEAFMAALLHDFGVPVQERLDPAGVAQLIAALNDPAADAVALEKSLVQVEHARCGQVIFDSWQLPPGIALAARHHEDPAAAPGPARELATLVHLGIRVALDAGFTHPLEPRQFRLAAEPLLRSVGMEPDALAALAEGLSERVLLLTATAA
jgi:putative nucleotidyltransferase with HDIG domain